MFTFLPPPQYDHKPTMPVIERVLSFTEVWTICNRLARNPSGSTTGGCWWKSPDGKVCYIIRINDARVARHERGHCNGWSNNHEGRRQ